MNVRFRLRHDAHVRADSTCAELREFFATQGGQNARATLTTSVADGRRLLADRERHVDDRLTAVKQIASWRRALHAGLAAVVRFCIFAKLDVLAKVVTPPRFASNTELLSDAQAIRDKVAPYRPALLDAGLPAHVLDDLPAQIRRCAPRHVRRSTP